MTSKLKAELVGETQVRMIRHFASSPERVFRAHFEPALVKQWMLGPPGWSMPVCEIAPAVGAPIHIEWEKDTGGERFGVTGAVRELDPPHRSVHTELFGFPGATESVVETWYIRDGTGTRLEMVITYTSKEARDAAMSSGMTDGMDASYARIDALAFA
ncbi:MAG: SRPBCC domain-containing protein [Deltaproteobacteria bacterium]|nr:SRPBCC domain-containing protein [Deltaproteobacteria bacterium]